MIKINGEKIVLDRFPNFEVLVKTDKLNEFNEKGKKVIIQFTSIIFTQRLHNMDLLKPLFVDGKLVRETSLAEIRNRLTQV